MPTLVSITYIALYSFGNFDMSMTTRLTDSIISGGEARQ